MVSWKAEGFLIQVAPALLHDGVDRSGSIVARSQRVFVGIDPYCVWRNLSANGGELRESRLVIKRKRGAGAEHGRNSAEVAARKSAFQ